MASWMRLAWLNRERIVAAARKLKWPLRTWVTLGVVALLGAAIYWVVTHGNVQLLGPGRWPLAQWVLLVVNVAGFGLLYRLTGTWFRTQDELRDEVDMLRSQVDDLRVAVHEHEHDVVELDDEDDGRPEAVGGPDTINAISSARPEVPPTTILPVVRQAPIGEREPATVERQLGGRTFSFRDG